MINTAERAEFFSLTSICCLLHDKYMHCLLLKCSNYHLNFNNVRFFCSESVFSSTGRRRWAGEFELCRIFPREASSASKRGLSTEHAAGCFYMKSQSLEMNLVSSVHTGMSESWSLTQRQMLEKTTPTCLTWTTRWTFLKCVLFFSFCSSKERWLWQKIREGERMAYFQYNQ